MEDIPVTTADLLEAWREATRAAELAARLARLAEEAAAQADEDSMASEEIAELADRVAEAATLAATKARSAAERASALAAAKRNSGVGDARHTEEAALAVEGDARERYHDAEAEARRRSAEEPAGRR